MIITIPPNSCHTDHNLMPAFPRDPSQVGQFGFVIPIVPLLLSWVCHKCLGHRTVEDGTNVELEEEHQARLGRDTSRAMNHGTVDCSPTEGTSGVKWG